MWIPFRGQRLFVAAHGHGPPVLVLHAFPTASYDYARVTPLLRDRLRLLLFDYPGFGFSDKPRRYPYSLLTYADALQAVAAHFGVTRAALLAHDIGTLVALDVLRRGAPLVERLVLLNGNVIVMQPLRDPLMRLAKWVLLAPLLGPLVGSLRPLRKAQFARLLAPLFGRRLAPTELDAFWSLAQYNDGAAIYQRLLSYMPERRRFQERWLRVLDRHPAPRTLIWGLADPVATPAVADALVARRPDTHVVRLPGVGHYPHWEAPVATASAIAAACWREVSLLTTGCGAAGAAPRPRSGAGRCSARRSCRT
jgi:pimeloyl-ACP methyl ester carboxylesterase